MAPSSYDSAHLTFVNDSQEPVGHLVSGDPNAKAGDAPVDWTAANAYCYAYNANRGNGKYGEKRGALVSKLQKMNEDRAKKVQAQGGLARTVSQKQQTEDVTRNNVSDFPLENDVEGGNTYNPARFEAPPGEFHEEIADDINNVDKKEEVQWAQANAYVKENNARRARLAFEKDDKAHYGQDKAKALYGGLDSDDETAASDNEREETKGPNHSNSALPKLDTLLPDLSPADFALPHDGGLVTFGDVAAVETSLAPAGEWHPEAEKLLKGNENKLPGSIAWKDANAHVWAKNAAEGRQNKLPQYMMRAGGKAN